MIIYVNAGFHQSLFLSLLRHEIIITATIFFFFNNFGLGTFFFSLTDFRKADFLNPLFIFH